MYDFLPWVCSFSNMAPYLLFGLLILGGLNVPFISEDLIILTGGAIAATCNEGTYFTTWLTLYIGCILSAWETYAIGRILGPKLYDIKWFNWAITPKRISTLESYFEKYGVWTFVVGRFIPGGVRNALYISAGMAKIAFPIFALRDGFAAIIYTNTLFFIGYFFGQNYDRVIDYLVRYNKIGLVLFLVFIGIVLTYFWKWRPNDDAA